MQALFNVTDTGPCINQSIIQAIESLINRSPSHSFIHTHIYSLIHSLIVLSLHSFIHSFMRSFYRYSVNAQSLPSFCSHFFIHSLDERLSRISPNRQYVQSTVPLPLPLKPETPLSSSSSGKTAKIRKLVNWIIPGCVQAQRTRNPKIRATGTQEVLCRASTAENTTWRESRVTIMDAPVDSLPFIQTPRTSNLGWRVL